MTRRIRISRGGAVAVMITLALVVAVTLLGCFGSSPTPRYFTLEPRLASVGEAEATRGTRTLYVARFDTAAPYDRHEIVYRPRDHELGVYAYRLWVMRPGPMLSEIVARDLSARGLFAEVTTRPGPSDLTLQGEVVALEEIDEAVTGGGLRARVAMRFELVSREGARLWTHAFSVVRPVPRDAQLSVVSTLTEIVRDELETLAAGLVPVLGRLDAAQH